MENPQYIGESEQVPKGKGTQDSANTYRQGVTGPR
jgi:hypothetical protein